MKYIWAGIPQQQTQTQETTHMPTTDSATEHGKTMAADGDATEQSGHPMSCDGSPALPLPESSLLGELLLEVEFDNGMSWTMPQELSTSILQEWHGGAQQVTFVWGWQDSCMVSYTTPEGEATTYNRCAIDFTTMYQRNIDNQRNRKVGIAYVVRREALSSCAGIHVMLHVHGTAT